MLRNEKPVYAHIDRRIPTGTRVSANEEPAGENDKSSLFPFSSPQTIRDKPGLKAWLMEPGSQLLKIQNFNGE